MNGAELPKKKKTSFFSRMASRGREAIALGQTLVRDPKSFPGELLYLLKRSFRTVWDARGGGLYACGFLITFFWLEIRMFAVDILEADSVGGFFSEQLSELVFRYLGQSLQNTISAFIWPVHIIEIKPPYGAGILIGLYVLFARFLKAPLERWLIDGDVQDNNLEG